MNGFLAGVHAIDSLLGAKSPEQIAREQTEASARANDAAISLVQGVNNVPRALSGLVSGGQWHDTNPFEQANNTLNNHLLRGVGYQPNSFDNVIQWGLNELPQFLVGRGIAKHLGTPNGVPLTKGPKRFTHPAELWWNAAAEVGKGLTDPAMTTQDALINGALNLVPAAGHTPLMKTALGIGGETLETDGQDINKQWGIPQ